MVDCDEVTVDSDDKIDDEEIVDMTGEMKSDDNEELSKVNGTRQRTGDLKLLGEYMAERPFVSAFGVEALENYVEINEELTYMDLDEDGDIVQEQGSSMMEVFELVDSMIENAVYDRITDEADSITTIIFHYFDPENTPDEDENEEVMNYADIGFIFENDQLYLSNIAPGWFEVSTNSMLGAEEYTDVQSIEYLKEINPELQL